MPTPVKHPHMIEGLPGGAGYEMGYYPFNRHTLNNNPAAAKGSIQRSRVVVKGGRRMKVPIALRERPDWTYSGAAQSQLLRGNYADIRNRDTAVREMTQGRNIEARLRAAFGLSRCSQAKENREVLAKTPGLVEAVGHVLMHAEPSESGKRCQFHALTILHNVLLESPKTDVFIGHDDTVLSGLLLCLEQPDIPLQELAMTCIDFLSISELNQPILCYKSGLLDTVAYLLKNTSSGYAVYHGLHALTYITTSRKTHHLMARHSGVLEVLLDTLSEHIDDPARCQQGIVALCNLMSLPENAVSIQALYNVDELVNAVLRQSEDEQVLEYCHELAARLQSTTVLDAGAAAAEEPQPQPQPAAAAAPHHQQHYHQAAHPPPPPRASRVSFNEDSIVIEEPSEVGYDDDAAYRDEAAAGAAGGGGGDGGWSSFDQRWETMRQEAMHKDVPSVAAEPWAAAATPSFGVGAGGAGGGGFVDENDPLELLDRYEAELNATMAEIGRETSYLGSPAPHLTGEGSGSRPLSKFKHLSPPRTQPSPFLNFDLDAEDPNSDSDDGLGRAQPLRGASSRGRYGLGSFAAAGTGGRGPSASVGGASDVWSVSGASDI
eukprot:Rhum_TRINITY_DN14300_c3_g1::Rhum_TRINITY_DN14300_c3_g1_i1::g.79645::m.79645